ncbi:MAG TPA: TonB-dependent receptor [Vicinamibacterales bacterium]|jgi:hypothetical protein|nr:TonB-dependent receptor [Vicinamibacterales bacterium]
MRRVVLCLLLLFVAATSAWAQGTIEGTVRDTAARALPGASVEAVNISNGGARTTLADSQGRYRLEELSPGLYALTFRLAGLQMLVVQRVELSSDRTLTLDAEMRAAPRQETITIVEYSPPVNTRSAVRTQDLFEDALLGIPNRRNYNSLLVVVPGVTTERNDIVIDPLTTPFPFHGGRANEGRVLMNGIGVGSAPNGGAPAEYLVDITNALEVSFATHAIDFNGGLGEVETGGLVMNVLPRDGGNRLSGSVSFAGNSAGMQGDNIDEDLRALGLRTPLPVENAWELGGAVGGPMIRDRAFYFVSGRRQSLRRQIPGLYFNQNAGNPATLLYAADFTRPAYSDRTWENVAGRLTLQASPKHMFTLFADEQAICRACTGATSVTGFPDSTISPEAQGVGDYPAQRVQQATWTTPLTRRLLLDARFGRTAYTWGNSERDDNNRGLVRVTGPSSPFSSLSLTYRSQDWADNQTELDSWHASASYVAGSHSFKAGYQGLFAIDDRSSHTNDHNVAYRLGTGFFSNQITQLIAPFTTHTRVAQASGYIQDTWSRDRLTLHGALRFDRARSWFPEQRIEPTRFLPAGLVFPETTGVDAYADLTPRFGLAYDVTGSGTTAVKVTVGKYLEGAGTSGVYGDSNPATRLVRSTARGWNDFNFNSVPDCVLETTIANGECGAINQLFFGQLGGPSVDASLLRGAGVRPSDWSVTAAAERQILAHSSVALEYHRRWFDGFTVIDNVLVGPGDFVSANVTPTFVSGTGGQRTIGPIYIQSPTSFTRFQQIVMPADRYGSQSLRTDSFDVAFTVHTESGVRLQGGPSTTWTSSDSCEIRAAVPESAPLNPYCRVSTPGLTQLRGLATYTVPRVGVQVGAVYQNKPGPAIVQNTSAFVGVSGFGFVTVNAAEPGTLYGERISQLDVRAVKEIAFGRARVLAGIDLYNAFNSSDALTYSSSIASFLTDRPGYPTSIMTPRILRVTADLRF